MKKIIYIILIAVLIMSCNSLKDCVPLASMSELKYKYDVKYAQLDEDTKIAYVDEGEGQPIIFIHGLGSYIPAWRKNIGELKNKFRCIAIDLPGYGKSSKIPHSGKMTYYSDIVMKFANKLNLKKFTLAGHSMGGQISMVTALENPTRIQNLILVAPAGFERFHKGQKQWFRDVMTFDLVRLTPVDAINSNLAVNFYNMPKDAEFMISDRIAMRKANDFEHYCYTVIQSVKGMVDQPVIDVLDKIKQRTLIFFGENDNLIPNRYLNPGKTAKIANYGANKIPNSTLVMAPKTGHFAMFENYNLFNNKVVEFLSK